MNSRTALLGLLLSALPTTPCLAKIPSPSNSSVDSVLLGGPSGALSKAGFVVIPRDVSGVPLYGALVTLHLTDPGLVIQQEQEEGTVVDCEARTLGRYAVSGEGAAVFHPRIGGYLNVAECQVRANGVQLRWVLVRSTDLDGDGTAGLLDLALFEENLFHSPDRPETDYNLDGTTGIADLALLREEIFAAAAGSTCP